MFRKLITVLSVAAFTLLMSTSALALKPVVLVDYEGPYDEFVIECGDYDVHNSSWIHLTLTDYLDKNGDVIRTHVWAHVWDSIFYNSEVPEIYISNQGAGNGENLSQWWNADGTMMEAGLLWRIMLPGIGKLYMTAGRGFWDGENWSWSGLEVLPENGSGSRLCDALAP